MKENKNVKSNFDCRYEILTSLPAYGAMYIPVTGDGRPCYSEGFPVRFYKTDGTTWIANFRLGWTQLKQVIELEKTSDVIVVAGGCCYRMDPDETKPLDVFGHDYCEIFKINNGRYVLQGEIDLTIIEPYGAHWATERISWDGLKEVKVENNVITGLSYDPMDRIHEWVEFSYDLDARTLTGGSYRKYNFNNKKPWWKIW